MQNITPNQHQARFWPKWVLGLFLLGAILLTTVDVPKTLAFTSPITTPPVFADYLLYSTSASHIQAIPLVTTGLPDLNSGVAVTASASCASDPDKPGISQILPVTGAWITVWSDDNSEESCYSRFISDGNGGYAETEYGSWPFGWDIVGADDLNQDGQDDLLLQQYRIDGGYGSNQYQVALGQPNGSFDFSQSPVTYNTQWVKHFTLTDVNNDGHADFVYFTLSDPYILTTAVKMLAGVGNGTFSNTAQVLLTNQHHANTITMADFNGDGSQDIYLAPDKNVQDTGQSYLALNQGSSYPLQESLDFRPTNEEWGGLGRLSVSARAFDVNMDGRMDLVPHLQDWYGGNYTTQVNWGDGTGNFNPTGATIFTGYSAGDPHIPRLAWGSLVEYGPTDPNQTAIYVSSSTGGRVEGIRFADEDILLFDPIMECWAMFFDGSDVGLRKHDVNAFHILNPSTILLSLNKPITIAGIRYDDSDIIKFEATSLGTDTAGTFSLYFDGSDVKLTRAGEDIDGISFTADGDLIISTLGTARVGFTAKDEDLLRFQAQSLGQNTVGSWSHYFDGSDIALNAKTEDVWAVWLDPQNGELHLSTQGKYSARTAGTTLSGDGDDVFVCIPIVLGSSTQCDFNLFWNGDIHDIGRELIDGYSVSALPTVPLFTSEAAVFASGRQADNSAESDEEGDTDDDDVLDDDDFTGYIYLPIIQSD